jgi:putative oxidoreductase
MAASSTAVSYGVQARSVPEGLVVLLGRFLFVAIFLMAGPNHFSRQTIAFAASQGVPLASVTVPLSGILALIGGLSILLGYRARLGA